MIKVICVGKIKEKYLKDAIEEYMTALNEIEAKEEEVAEFRNGL